MSLTNFLFWLRLQEAYYREARREAAEKEVQRNMERLKESGRITPGEVRRKQNESK